MPQPGDLPPPAGDVQPADPADPAAVLDGLEVLELTVAGDPFREAVSPAYERLRRRTTGTTCRPNRAAR